MAKNDFIEVSRQELEFGSMYIDTNNPKFELNYLYVDSENVVCTNTRALSVVSHQNVGVRSDLKLYIPKEVVVDALKKKLAVKFYLENASITCINAEGIEFMKISGVEMSSGCYPDYKRIVGKVNKDSHPFTQLDQITGIIASKMVEVDKKYIPKFKGEYMGRVHFGADDSGYEYAPVQIKFVETYTMRNVRLIMMPIVDTFKEFKEGKI